MKSENLIINKSADFLVRCLNKFSDKKTINIKKLMKTTLFFFVLFLSVTSAFSQELFKSTTEVGVKPYTPTMEFKEKVSKIYGNPVGVAGGDEYNVVLDKDFYQLKNGFISFYPDNEYAHFRIIFDEKQNWVETHQLYHSDVLPEDTYYQMMPKMQKIILQKKYPVEDIWYYIKITNAKGYWYEVKVIKKNDTQIFIFDKDLKLIDTKKL